MNIVKSAAAACAILLLACSALGAQQSKAGGAATGKKKLVINGKVVPASKVVVKEAATYVEIEALAGIVGGKVHSNEAATTLTLAALNCDAGRPGTEGQRFSQEFRSDVAGLPDEIESLRAVMTKKESVPLGPRFDAIDRKLTLATTEVQTDADMAVYYALSYANNSLAIAYYKRERGVPQDEAQKDQLDSMMCSMESKFALMKGVLLPGGSCSVFQRMEAQRSAKPATQP